jgi:hypothetical protein
LLHKALFPGRYWAVSHTKTAVPSRSSHERALETRQLCVPGTPALLFFRTLNLHWLDGLFTYPVRVRGERRLMYL